jgi:tetratricopeptide (TPR) repeat protein
MSTHIADQDQKRRVNAPNTPSPEMSTLVQKGTQLLEGGDLRGALDAFEQVVAMFPDRPEGHNNLGALFTAMGEHARAEACFDRVLAIIPDNPSLHYNRGMARSNQEKFDLAREDFCQVLAADPQDTDCLNNLGVMDFMQGRFPAAREHFQQALEIKPDYSRALLNLCDVEMATGNSPRAISLCEEFLNRFSSLEVRRALLDLLSSGCREALDKADRTAEALLASNREDNQLNRKLEQIRQAKAALAEMAAI